MSRENESEHKNTRDEERAQQEGYERWLRDPKRLSIFQPLAVLMCVLAGGAFVLMLIGVIRNWLRGVESYGIGSTVFVVFVFGIPAALVIRAVVKATRTLSTADDLESKASATATITFTGVLGTLVMIACGITLAVLIVGGRLQEATGMTGAELGYVAGGLVVALSFLYGIVKALRI